MNMTSKGINLTVESLPNPLEGHIPPVISLQEAIEAYEWHHIHNRHNQIRVITLISCVYMISYAYILYDIVFDIDAIVNDTV
jgi:hypothetical protein